MGLTYIVTETLKPVGLDVFAADCSALRFTLPSQFSFFSHEGHEIVCEIKIIFISYIQK